MARRALDAGEGGSCTAEEAAGAQPHVRSSRAAAGGGSFALSVRAIRVSPDSTRRAGGRAARRAARRRRRGLGRRQLAQRVAERRRRHLLQERFLRRARNSSAHTCGASAARRAGSRSSRRGHTIAAHEDAAEEDVALLRPLHRALQLHRVVHELEHRLDRHLALEDAEHLDQRGAEALARAVARAREPAHEPPHRVHELDARLARRFLLVRLLRLLESVEKRLGRGEPLLLVDRREVPEKGEDGAARRD